MAIVPLRSLAIGETVKIRINNVLQDFTIIKRGMVVGAALLLHQYENFENATVLFAKNTQTGLMPWDTNENIQYDLSSVARYLDESFYNSIEEEIRDSIIRVGIPVSDHSTTSSSSLFTSYHYCWLPSCNEFGSENTPKLGDTFFPQNSNASKPYRPSDKPWWCRNAKRISSKSRAQRYTADGTLGYADSAASECALRPALALPNSIMVDTVTREILAAATPPSFRLSSIGIGETVKVKIDGVLRDFYVIHQGAVTGTATLITNYMNFEHATVLFAKETQTDLMVWDTGGSNRYDLTSSAQYLDNTYFNSIDSTIRNSIIEVGIPVSNFSSSGSGSLFASYHRCWLPSNNEFKQGTTPHLGVGFWETTHQANPYRLSDKGWWSRNGHSRSSPSQAFGFDVNGKTGSKPVTEAAFALRPAFALPDSLYVDGLTREVLPFAASSDLSFTAMSDQPSQEGEDSAVLMNFARIEDVSGEVSRNTNEFFFYSNGPESPSTDPNQHIFAEDGYCLSALYSASGSGQIYTWHHSNHNDTIFSAIYVENPGSTNVTITVKNLGLTNHGAGSDSDAWVNYLTEYNGTSYSITPGNSMFLFQQTVRSAYSFGIIASIEIFGGAVNLYDIVTKTANPLLSISSYAGPAPDNPAHLRGNGQGFYQILTCPTYDVDVSTMNAEQKLELEGYLFGAKQAKYTSFNGEDCIPLTDPSNSQQVYLEGNFGSVMRMRTSFNAKASGEYRVFIGSYVFTPKPGEPEKNASFGFPLITLQNPTTGILEVGRTNWQSYPCCVDVIGITGVTANTTVAIPEFTLVIPAASTTPYLIGIRHVG